MVQLLLGKIEVLTGKVAAMSEKVTRLEGKEMAGLDGKETAKEIPVKVYKRVDDLGRKIEEYGKSFGDRIREYDRKLPNVIGSHVREITRKEKEEGEEKLQKRERLKQQLLWEQQQQQKQREQQLSDLQEWFLYLCTRTTNTIKSVRQC